MPRTRANYQQVPGWGPRNASPRKTRSAAPVPRRTTLPGPRVTLEGRFVFPRTRPVWGLRGWHSRPAPPLPFAKVRKRKAQFLSEPAWSGEKSKRKRKLAPPWFPDPVKAGAREATGRGTPRAGVCPRTGTTNRQRFRVWKYLVQTPVRAAFVGRTFVSSEKVTGAASQRKQQV